MTTRRKSTKALIVALALVVGLATFGLGQLVALRLGPLAASMLDYGVTAFNRAVLAVTLVLGGDDEDGESSQIALSTYLDDAWRRRNSNVSSDHYALVILAKDGWVREPPPPEPEPEPPPAAPVSWIVPPVRRTQQTPPPPEPAPEDSDPRLDRIEPLDPTVPTAGEETQQTPGNEQAGAEGPGEKRSFDEPAKAGNGGGQGGGLPKRGPGGLKPTKPAKEEPESEPATEEPAPDPTEEPATEPEKPGATPRKDTDDPPPGHGGDRSGGPGSGGPGDHGQGSETGGDTEP